MDEQPSPEFKARVVREILRGKRPLAEIAAENGSAPDELLLWQAQALEALPSLFERKGKVAAEEAALRAAQEAKVRKLRAEIDRLTMQIAWMKRKTGVEPRDAGPDEP